MDKASDFGSEDCAFESRRVHFDCGNVELFKVNLNQCVLTDTVHMVSTLNSLTKIKTTLILHSGRSLI